MAEKDVACQQQLLTRRSALQAALGLGLGLPLLNVTAASDDPKTTRPQAGDRLVFLLGEKKGQVIKPDDLALGGPQQLAWPMEPKDKIVRDGSRLNEVLLIRMPVDQLSEEMRAHAAEGVVAYSAICTHQGCDVSMWKADKQTLLCVCHGSEFDPKDRARVTAGPAPRRLAVLPLKVEEGVLVAAAELTGRVGFKT